MGIPTGQNRRREGTTREEHQRHQGRRGGTFHRDPVRPLDAEDHVAHAKQLRHHCNPEYYGMQKKQIQ